MIEIERKFLVIPDAWPRSEEKITMRQGYLSDQDGLVCRVRQKNEAFYLSLKARIDSLSSYDYEYLIPAEDGLTMLNHICTATPISKVRHIVRLEGLVWEVDVFGDLNQGLIVAEVELPSASHIFELPEWIDCEITQDLRYRNSALYKNPWTQWSENR